MIDAKTWVYQHLISDATLTALLGGSPANLDHIRQQYPNDFMDVPLVIFSEINQAAAWYADNRAQARDCTIEIHVFTKFIDDTTPLVMAVGAVMENLLFHELFSSDIEDPIAKYRHRVMRFQRAVTQSDLAA